MIRVLVTGGAGYIGSHTAKALSQRGFEPVTLDNLITGHLWAVQWGPFVQADIADQQVIRDVVRQYDIQAVLHFAAYASVAESMAAPARYFNNNVCGAIKLLNALVESSVKHVLFSSSCAVYGFPERVPITESHPRCPVNPYGESKLMIENVLRWYGQAYGISSVCLRYFNAAGADRDGDIGEVHDLETHLIPLAIQTAIGQISNLEVYGTDYPTQDRTAVRDYTHVSDLAEAHVLALEYLLDGGASNAFNLGTGKGHSVLDVIKAVETVLQKRIPVHLSPRRAGDPPVLVADPAKASEVLGWCAKYTDVTEIVRTAWNWHRGSDRFPQASPAYAA